ncbi:DUF3568 family protein [Pseudofrancisella aestuarii]|uniref:DUF3568 family protein n=1 Tax=Pseudofrancisella aestuarii TaxID=2670347 RepID=A0ABV9TF70_9GAMM|nr:DUF3568 family protein [Pseudofrancisella aestuarii]
MKRVIRVLFVSLLMLNLSGCIWAVGDLAANDGAIESNDGVYNVEEQGVTVKQLYNVFIQVIEQNPEKFKLIAKDYSPEKAVVYLYTYDDNNKKVQIEFYAFDHGNGNSLLGIKIGNDTATAEMDMPKIHQLENMILNVLNQSNPNQ